MTHTRTAPCLFTTLGPTSSRQAFFSVAVKVQHTQLPSLGYSHRGVGPRTGGRRPVFLVHGGVRAHCADQRPCTKTEDRRKKCSNQDQSTLNTCVTSPRQITSREERSVGAVPTTTTGKKERPAAPFRGREPWSPHSTLLARGLSRDEGFGP